MDGFVCNELTPPQYFFNKIQKNSLELLQVKLKAAHLQCTIKVVRVRLVNKQM